jgi:hypothetical protein
MKDKTYKEFKVLPFTSFFPSIGERVWGCEIFPLGK